MKVAPNEVFGTHGDFELPTYYYEAIHCDVATIHAGAAEFARVRPRTKRSRHPGSCEPALWRTPVKSCELGLRQRTATDSAAVAVR